MLIATSFLPAARAARMNSRCQMPSAAPRVSRAKTGTLKMPIASIALAAPGPASAVIITAVSSAGKAKARSVARITSSSIQPPRAAASAPIGTPKPTPTATAITATAIELCAPAITIDSTSRPNGSVPSGCASEGGASLWTMSIAVGG